MGGSNFVADLIEDTASQVGEEAAGAGSIEVLNMIQYPKQTDLDDVGGVDQPSSMAGQASARPPFEERAIQGKQLVRRLLIP